jgi:hypothetical protein
MIISKSAGVPLATFIAALIIGAPLSAQQGPPPQQAPPTAQVELDGVDLVDAGADFIKFNVRTHTTAKTSVKVRRITFSGMHLAGVPVYLGPVEGPLQLRAGQDITLPTIPLTIYFRDLDSLAPLERIITDERVAVEGQARVEFDLNLIQKLLMRQWSGHAEFPIQQSMPVLVPGGPFGKIAALAALQAANAAIGMANSTLGSLRRSQSNWQDEIGKQYIPALVLAQSRYSLMTTDGQRLDMTLDGVGFRTPNHRFVLTSEMLVPWKFNAQVASMLQDKRATLMPESIELLVWPGDAHIEPGTARAMTQGAIRIVQVKESDETVEVPAESGYTKVRVSKRDTNKNLSTLEFTNPQDAGPVLELASKDRMNNGSWDRIALFRFTESSRPEVVYLPAHRDGNRLVLEGMMDESAFGSPMVTPEGAIAMLQDEHSGLFMDKVF